MDLYSQQQLSWQEEEASAQVEARFYSRRTDAWGNQALFHSERAGGITCGVHSVLIYAQVRLEICTVHLHKKGKQVPDNPYREYFVSFCQFKKSALQRKNVVFNLKYMKLFKR